jgi:hypothetical protein
MIIPSFNKIPHNIDPVAFFERGKLRQKELTEEESKSRNLKKKIYAAKYRLENSDKIKLLRDDWKSKNRDYSAKWQKRKKEEDPIYAMSMRLRIRTCNAFRNNGFKKASPTEKMLGCSFKQFTKHIEKQFLDGMNWQNRGKWHIDHIIPMSCATTIEGLEKLSHYSNLRPLWAKDNLSKSDNLVLIQ